jgi:hypothetical protein
VTIKKNLRILDPRALTLVSENDTLYCDEVGAKTGTKIFAFKRPSLPGKEGLITIKKIRGDILQFRVPRCMIKYRGSECKIYASPIEAYKFKDEVFRTEVYVKDTDAKHPRINNDGSIAIPMSYLADRVDETFELGRPGVLVHINTTGLVNEGLLIAQITLANDGISYSLNGAYGEWTTGPISMLVNLVRSCNTSIDAFEFYDTKHINETPNTPYGIMVFRRKDVCEKT